MILIMWRVLLTVGYGLYVVACAALSTEAHSPTIKWALWAAASAHLIFGVESAMRVRALVRERQVKSEIILIETKPRFDPPDEAPSGSSDQPTDAGQERAA